MSCLLIIIKYEELNWLSEKKTLLEIISLIFYVKTSYFNFHFEKGIFLYRFFLRDFLLTALKDRRGPSLSWFIKHFTLLLISITLPGPRGVESTKFGNNTQPQ